MWLILLIGCLSYEEGQLERGRLNCELAELCGTLDTVFGYDSVDACVAQVERQEWSEENCPSYSPGQMQDCIEAYEVAIADQDCEADLKTICMVCD